MDRLAALQLDSHRFGSNRRLSKIEFIKPIVDILGHREVLDCARTLLVSAVGVNLRVVIVFDLRGRMEVIIIDEGHGRIFKVTDEDLQSVLFNPG